MIEIIEYIGGNGKSAFGDWLSSLDARAAAKITSAIYRMEQGNFGDSKTVGEGLIERRIDTGPGYRIYYARDGKKLVILFGGGTKRKQQNDIRNAQKAWEEYKQRKKLED